MTLKSHFAIKTPADTHSCLTRDVSTFIRPIAPEEFTTRTRELVDIYVRAMHYDPAITESRIFAWKQMSYQQGFAGAIATDEKGRALGICFGRIGTSQHWWHKQVLFGLCHSTGVSYEQQKLLRSYFEISEMHVDPDHQGKGLGSQLLKELGSQIPCRYAMLSTPEVGQQGNAAFSLYRRFGFTDVLRNFIFNGDERPFAVLAAPLPLEAQP